MPEMRDFFRVDGVFDDSIIAMAMIAAREHAEAYLRRSLVTRSLRFFADDFHSSDWTRLSPFASAGSQFSTQNLDNFTRNLVTLVVDFAGDDKLHLPFPPIVSVASVKYIDTAGNLITLDPANYVVDKIEGTVSAAFGKAWPATRAVDNAVQVDYDAGFGTAADVPGSIKFWICRRAADLYEHRELQEDPKGYALIRQYRLERFA